jgi:predicted RNA-binding Zn ribbon-like protein
VFYTSYHAPPGAWRGATEVSEDAHATVVAGHAAHIFDLDAGALCLNFANTLEGRVDPVPRERLGDYAALLGFGRQTDTLSDAESAALTDAAAREPRAAAATYSAAIALREAIFRLFSAIAADEAPNDADLAALNAAYAAANAHGAIAHHDDHFDWVWEADSTALERPLWPIAQAAAELLLEGDLSRVRQCAADDCAWLFYDTSRNHSRRWCSMSSCGNRAKVGNFRKRERREQGTGNRE